MSIAVLDGSTIRSFVGDEAVFRRSVDDRFLRLDTNRDGLLSYSEFLYELQRLRVVDSSGFGEEAVARSGEQLSLIYAGMFQAFDRDRSGAIDMAEFREEMKRMLLGVADGLGALPVQMVLEDDSFLKFAADLESSAF
ncbi:hypothetical protein EJ110_NYTH56957 [Nymphaea thermarum]|nr:hypothetical protein EJ110_NYTH56957 [Nymphaea thermarum]